MSAAVRSSVIVGARVRPRRAHGSDLTGGAGNADAAIRSAFRDVQKAVPDARLVEPAPDLVEISDIADFFAFSRQNTCKLVQTHSETFPLPLHKGL